MIVCHEPSAQWMAFVVWARTASEDIVSLCRLRQAIKAVMCSVGNIVRVIGSHTACMWFQSRYWLHARGTKMLTRLNSILSMSCRVGVWYNIQLSWSSCTSTQWSAPKRAETLKMNWLQYTATLTHHFHVGKIWCWIYISACIHMHMWAWKLTSHTQWPSLLNKYRS